MKWRTLSGAKVPDIAEYVAHASRDGQIVHVGTDSLQTGRYTQFVSVVVVHTPGKGGTAAYSREVVKRITSLRERLLKEVYRSVEVAMGFNEAVRGELQIHIDANASEKHMSSRYLQELTGLVLGQGFCAIIKPHAWAASHVADHIVRTQGKLPAGLHALPRAETA